MLRLYNTPSVSWRKRSLQWSFISQLMWNSHTEDLAVLKATVELQLDFTSEKNDHVWDGESPKENCNTQSSFPSGSAVKNLPVNAGDTGLILVPGRNPGEGNGNLLQCSYLENLMDRWAWWASLWNRRVIHNLVTEQQHTIRQIVIWGNSSWWKCDKMKSEVI